MNLLLAGLLYALLVKVASLHLYEGEHTIVDLTGRIGFDEYSFETKQCSFEDSFLADVNLMIKPIPKITGLQTWPSSPVVKTQFFESGDLDVKTGAFLTADFQVHLFSDNSFNLSNISAQLKQESYYQLHFDYCSDMRIYNQTLFVLCLNDTKLFLNTFQLFLEKSYQMKLKKCQTLGLVEATQLKMPYLLELNRDYLALYQRHKESFHLYKFTPERQLDYLGFPNVSMLLGQSVQIVRLIFAYDDQSSYNGYIAVLGAKQGAIVLYAEDDGHVQLIDTINPIPFGESYLDLYRQSDPDRDECNLFMVSNNFITMLNIEFFNTGISARIVRKNRIQRLDNIVSYSVDRSCYYCLTHNESTGVNDFIMTHRNPLFRQLYIANFTGSYFTYEADNVLLAGLRNRLRVIAVDESKQAQIETYTFYRCYVNISLAMLPASTTSAQCLLKFKTSQGKQVTLPLVILRKDQKDTIPFQGVPLNEKYIDLEVSKSLQSYIQGPAPEYKIVASTDNLLRKTLYSGYHLQASLIDSTNLVPPLIYSKMMSVIDDDITNMKQSLLVVQDSQLNLAIFILNEINGEIETFDGECFPVGSTVKSAINFQEIVVIIYKDGLEKAEIYQAEDGNIKFLKEYSPSILRNLTNVHYSILPGLPNLIAIVQDQQPENHPIYIEITQLPSQYSSFYNFQRLPIVSVQLFGSFPLYNSFDIQFLGNGALIGHLSGNRYQMFTVDLYMGSPSRVLAVHTAEPNAKIIFGYETEYSRPVLIEITQDEAVTYDIIGLDSQASFIFTVGKTLPNFGFVFSESGLADINNGFAVIEATLNGSSYLLAYQLNMSSFNSLRQIIPMDPQVVYLTYDYPLIIDYSYGFCIAGINSEVVLKIECFHGTQLRLLMSPKSNDHIANVTISYGNRLEMEGSEPKLLKFGLDFVYQDIDLELMSSNKIYTSGSEILLEEFFRGPIEDCYQAATPITYLNRKANKVDFLIDDMCQHLSSIHHQKVSSKNWVVLICGGGIWVIQNNQNKTTKLSNLTLMEIWGNPIKQFLTSEKWAIVGYNDQGFYLFIKETASWAGNFSNIMLFDFEGQPFDLSQGLQRKILEFFVFVDMQSQLKLDFLLFHGYSTEEGYSDRTIGIYLSQNGSAYHHQIYEFSAKDIATDILDASGLNVSCLERSDGETYQLVLTFKSQNSFLYIVKMALSGVKLKVSSVGRADLSEQLKKANIVPHNSKLFEYEMLDIDTASCRFIVTTDFVIAGLTVSFDNYSVQLETIYADYMGCRNQQAANQFGKFVALTCQFQTDINLYLKVYHRTNSAVVNITQFISLPVDIGDREYLDRIGWNFDVLEYGILLESYPFQTTNFTYYFFTINQTLSVHLEEHFGEVELCCRNQFTLLCATLTEDIDDQTAFWAFIVVPLCICFVMIAVGVVYIKNYKQRMLTWAENYTE